MSSPFASLMYLICTLGAVLSLCGMYLTGTNADAFMAFCAAAIIFLGGLLTVVLSLVFTTEN